MFIKNTGYSDHIGISRLITNRLRDYRLVHLKPKGFTFNGDDAMLICEYDSKALDKYIPDSIKVMFTTNDKLFNDLMSKANIDKSNLWRFAPFGYMVPQIGKHW